MKHITVLKNQVWEILALIKDAANVKHLANQLVKHLALLEIKSAKMKTNKKIGAGHLFFICLYFLEVLWGKYINFI